MKIILSTLFIFLFIHFNQAQNNASKEKRLVLVVDIQNYYTQKNKGPEVEPFIKNVNTIIEQTPVSDIIYIKTLSLAVSISFKGTKVDTLPGHEFDQRLKVVNDQVYIKESGDAFQEKELIEFIEKNNYKEIIVTGLLAEKCVYKTLIGGLEKGYKMYIIPDAIIGKSEKSKAKVLKKLDQAGVDLLN